MTRAPRERETVELLLTSPPEQEKGRVECRGRARRNRGDGNGSDTRDVRGEHLHVCLLGGVER